MAEKTVLDEIRESHSQYIGRPVKEFIQAMKLDDMTVRVMNKNGSNCIGTADFRMDRVNVAIVGDNLTEIRSIG